METTEQAIARLRAESAALEAELCELTGAAPVKQSKGKRSKADNDASFAAAHTKCGACDKSCRFAGCKIPANNAELCREWQKFYRQDRKLAVADRMILPCLIHLKGETVWKTSIKTLCPPKPRKRK